MIHWNSLNQLINCCQNIKTIKQSLLVLSFDWEAHHEFPPCNSFKAFITYDLLVSKFMSNASCEVP